MLKERHFEKALNMDFQDENLSKMFAQNVCIAFINDWENGDYENTLIFRLIQKENFTQLSEIIYYFLDMKEEVDENCRKKTKQVWNTIFDIATQNINNVEYRKILSLSTSMISLFDRIDDEIFAFLSESVKYLDIDDTDQIFIEKLKKFVDVDIEKVGRIFLAMVENNITPLDKESDIIEIIQNIYEKNYKEIADKICNVYAEKGHLFLRETYNKYNT